MTTPLKALIQERLRAKIVRQEVDDENDDSDVEGHEDDERGDLRKIHSRRTVQVHVHAAHPHHRRHASDDLDSMLMDQYRSIVPTPTHHEYASNQNLMDYYYSYSEPCRQQQQQQEVANEGRGEFRRNAYDDKRFYDEEDEHRSPLPSPWRQPQAEGRGRYSFECRGGSNAVLKSPYGGHHQQQHVHPTDSESFPSRSSAERTQDRRGQETRSHGHGSLDYDPPSNQQRSERHESKHRYPRGYFASQLYLDSKQQKSHEYQPHRRQLHGFGDDDHARQQNESPNPSLQEEKHEYGTFDGPYEMMEGMYDESRSARRHERKNHSEHFTRHKAPQSEEGSRRHASRRIAPPSVRITSPLAAASHISSMMPSREAVASPCPVETSHRYTNQPHRSSMLPIPTPLDMTVIDPPRRSEFASQATSNNSSSNSSTSSNKYTRRLNSILSPACHLAAKAFVAKRQKRSANSTPRTMATKRWLQSFDNPDYIDMDAVRIQDPSQRPWTSSSRHDSP